MSVGLFCVVLWHGDDPTRVVQRTPHRTRAHALFLVESVTSHSCALCMAQVVQVKSVRVVFSVFTSISFLDVVVECSLSSFPTSPIPIVRCRNSWWNKKKPVGNHYYSRGHFETWKAAKNFWMATSETTVKVDVVCWSKGSTVRSPSFHSQQFCLTRTTFWITEFYIHTCTYTHKYMHKNTYSARQHKKNRNGRHRGTEQRGKWEKTTSTGESCEQWRWKKKSPVTHRKSDARVWHDWRTETVR